MFFDGGLQGVKLPPGTLAVNNANNFQGLGALYAQKLAGDGRISFCPSMDEAGKDPALSSTLYSPLLTTSTMANER